MKRFIVFILVGLFVIVFLMPVLIEASIIDDMVTYSTLSSDEVKALLAKAKAGDGEAEYKLGAWMLNKPRGLCPAQDYFRQAREHGYAKGDEGYRLCTEQGISGNGTYSDKLGDTSSPGFRYNPLIAGLKPADIKRIQKQQAAGIRQFPPRKKKQTTPATTPANPVVTLQPSTQPPVPVVIHRYRPTMTYRDATMRMIFSPLHQPPKNYTAAEMIRYYENCINWDVRYGTQYQSDAKQPNRYREIYYRSIGRVYR